MRNLLVIFAVLFLAVNVTLVAHVGCGAHNAPVDECFVVGQEHRYEWEIINVATGEVIYSGSDIVVPTTNQDFRNVEHYIRSAVLGWNSRTRTVDGVRQRIVIRVQCDDVECEKKCEEKCEEKCDDH